MADSTSPAKWYAISGCLLFLSLSSAGAGVLCLVSAGVMNRASGPATPAPGSSGVEEESTPAESTSDRVRAVTETQRRDSERDRGFLEKVRTAASGARKRGGTSGGSSPSDGEYGCYINAGSPRQIFVQKFGVDGDSYRDLSFGKGSGEFSYDPADGSMIFENGPFEDQYLGVYVAQGSTIRKSTRFTYRYPARVAKSDTIHLLDPKVDYGTKIVFGIYCSRQP